MGLLKIQIYFRKNSEEFGVDLADKIHYDLNSAKLRNILKHRSYIKLINSRFSDI